MPNSGTLHIYEPSSFKDGIKGFIDAQGIKDLLWVQENLGGVMKIAGGICPNCGNKQITIYMGFEYTNCLVCNFRLSLAPKTAFKPPLIEERTTIDVDYEEVNAEATGVAKLVLIDFNLNAKVEWPMRNKWHYRIWNRIKNFIYRLFNK